MVHFVTSPGAEKVAGREYISSQHAHGLTAWCGVEADPAWPPDRLAAKAQRRCSLRSTRHLVWNRAPRWFGLCNWDLLGLEAPTAGPVERARANHGHERPAARLLADFCVSSSNRPRATYGDQARIGPMDAARRCRRRARRAADARTPARYHRAASARRARRPSPDDRIGRCARWSEVAQIFISGSHLRFQALCWRAAGRGGDSSGRHDAGMDGAALTRPAACS